MHGRVDIYGTCDHENMLRSEALVILSGVLKILSSDEMLNSHRTTSKYVIVGRRPFGTRSIINNSSITTSLYSKICCLDAMTQMQNFKLYRTMNLANISLFWSVLQNWSKTNPHESNNSFIEFFIYCDDSYR